MSFNRYERDHSSRTAVDFLQQLFLELQESQFQFPDFPVLGNVPDNKRRINFLLLGKTGHGKSATGNSTLGHNAFESKSSMTSVTSEVQSGQVELDDYLVTVIDSPGLVDTSFNEDKVLELEQAIKNMEKAIRMCPEGIHAFLFVVKFGSRFTNEEQAALHSLRQIFGHSFLEERGIIVFTHGDTFEHAMEEDETPEKGFDEWCEEQTGPLGDLMVECDYRCVLFNNRHKDEKQKQVQMYNVIELALDFDEPYTFRDFCECEHFHDKLIVGIKAPKLKEEFQCKINNLNSEMENSCSSANTTEAQFQHFEQKWENLKMEIRHADKSTGLLDELEERISFAISQIEEYKRKQAAARQQQIYLENSKREAAAHLLQMQQESLRLQLQIQQENLRRIHIQQAQRDDSCSIL